MPTSGRAGRITTNGGTASTSCANSTRRGSASEDTHYSVVKVLRFQHTRSIMLKSQPDGQMDYADLRETGRTRVARTSYR